jgi:hypothetical protein
VVKAKYDGLAEWYDREQARVAQRPDAPLDQFAQLAEPAGGLIGRLLASLPAALAAAIGGIFQPLLCRARPGPRSRVAKSATHPRADLSRGKGPPLALQKL